METKPKKIFSFSIKKYCKRRDSKSELCCLFLVGDEVHADAVDAVPSIFLGEMFANEDVSKVSAAVGTLYFGADPIGVRQPLHGARDLIVKTGPPAICLKLALAAVQWCTASFANVGAFLPKSEVFTGERRLCAFILDNPFFRRRKFSSLILSRQKIAT